VPGLGLWLGIGLAVGLSDFR